MTRARKPTVSCEDKLKRIRALYMLVYNADTPLQPLAIELFHVIGEILEGVTPEEVEMFRIDKHKFLRELEAD